MKSNHGVNFGWPKALSFRSGDLSIKYIWRQFGLSPASVQGFNGGKKISGSNSWISWGVPVLAEGWVIIPRRFWLHLLVLFDLIVKLPYSAPLCSMENPTHGWSGCWFPFPVSSDFQLWQQVGSVPNPSSNSEPSLHPCPSPVSQHAEPSWQLPALGTAAPLAAPARG